MVKKKKEKEKSSKIASWVTHPRISFEFNQSGKKQAGINYAMKFSCRSHTVTLANLCVPFVSQKNK